MREVSVRPSAAALRLARSSRPSGSRTVVQGVKRVMQQQEDARHPTPQPASPEPLICTSVVQLGCHDDAGAHVVLANPGDSLPGSALRVSDRV